MSVSVQWHLIVNDPIKRVTRFNSDPESWARRRIRFIEGNVPEVAVVMRVPERTTVDFLLEVSVEEEDEAPEVEAPEEAVEGLAVLIFKLEVGAPIVTEGVLVATVLVVSRTK